MNSENFTSQKIIVLGANIEGYNLCRYLIKNGAHTILASQRPLDDVKTEAATFFNSEELTKLNIEAEKLDSGSFNGTSLVIVAADVPLDLNILESVRAMGTPVVSELEFVSQRISKKFIAITGTNGKSTTAYIIEEILKKSGRKVFSNYERALAEALNDPEEYDHYIASCSAFQLEGTRNFSPDMILFLNMSMDQKDHYPNFENYLAANREVLKNVNDSSLLIVNSNDENIVNFVQGIPGRCIFFGNQEVLEGFEGVWLKDNRIYLRLRNYQTTLEYDLSQFVLRGHHNKQNLMAAITACLNLDVKATLIQEALQEIKVPKYRLKYITKINDIPFYNDSCSTNPDSSYQAVHSFDQPIILVMGGKENSIEYTQLGPSVRQKVKNLILLGSSKEKINRNIGDCTETFLVGTLEEAALISYQKSRNGDVVIFSPGCPSEKPFLNEIERGKYFSGLIRAIKNKKKSISV